MRALDNVLDVTFWPLPRQQAESAAKRRIGVGFTGMGNTLAMLKLRYDRQDGRDMAVQIAERMRNAAYRASIELAKEKGAFPSSRPTATWPRAPSPAACPRTSRSRSKARHTQQPPAVHCPTGTVSLAFADNASNGIEPPFSWTYTRRKREVDGSKSEYVVEDYAWRLYKTLGGDVKKLLAYFVSAMDMAAADHVAMMEAVQPYVDTAISRPSTCRPTTRTTTSRTSTCKPGTRA